MLALLITTVLLTLPYFPRFITHGLPAIALAILLLAVFGLMGRLLVGAVSGYSLYASLVFPLPPPLVALWVIAVVGLVVKGFDAAGYHGKYLFLSLLLLGSLLLSIPREMGLPSFLVLPAFVIPLAIGLVAMFSLVTARSRLVIAFSGLVLLVLPRPGSADVDTLGGFLAYYGRADYPILVGKGSGATGLAEGADLLNRQCQSLGTDVYYDLDPNRLLAISPARIASLVPRSVLDSQPGVIALYPSEGAVPSVSEQLVTQRSLNATQTASVFLRHVPQNGPAYQVETLTLMQAQIIQDEPLQPGDSVLLGIDLQIDSWWVANELLSDNYVAKISMVRSSGEPIVGVENIIGNTFTAAWIAHMIHFDRLTLHIPQELKPGQYNLVLSVHGTMHGTTNLALQGNGAAGEYAYLTTLNVRSP